MPHVLENIQDVSSVPQPKEDFMYVSIPETDIYDAPYPTIQLNRIKFEAGNTYKVPTPVGLEVEDRKRLFEKECIRLLRPKADSKSIDQINKGSMWTRKGGGSMHSGESIDSVLEKDDKVIAIQW